MNMQNQLTTTDGPAGSLALNPRSALSFFTLAKMLWRTNDWQKRNRSMFDDAIEHKHTALYFYANEATTFRGDGGLIRNDTNPLTWLLLKPIVARLRRMVLPNVNDEGGPETPPSKQSKP